MSENELIELFSKFGYEILKHANHYSVFDRRIARRTIETNSLDGLKDYAENIFCFNSRLEILEKTVSAFQDVLCPSPVTSSVTLREESVTGKEDGEETDGDPDPEQEQEETTAPVSPETEPEEPTAKPETDSPTLFTKICKGCGREFQTAHKQSMYCSPACYPSNKEKPSQSPKSPEKPVAVLQRPF